MPIITAGKTEPGLQDGSGWKSRRAGWITLMWWIMYRSMESMPTFISANLQEIKNVLREAKKKLMWMV